MKIHILPYLSDKTSYIIIPFLESNYHKNDYSVFKMINNCINNKTKITLNNKYKDACAAIDKKFQDKMINIATITVLQSMTGGMISRNKLKKTESQIHSRNAVKTKKNINTLGNELLQIYLIRIDSETNNKNIRDTNVMLEELRVCGHLIFSLLKSNFIGNINLIPLIECKDFNNACIHALLEGIMLSSYKFDNYKTKKALERKDMKDIYHLENIFLIMQETNNLNQQITKLEKVVASVFLARDLINEPANDNKVERFLSQIKEFINSMQVSVELEIWNKQQLEKMGMGLILGVGKGSKPENAPCILLMKYHSKSISTSNKKHTIPDWVLLGKGITFDTGGLNLKKGTDMLDMKSDLSGAAAVVSFLLGYAANNGDKNIYVLCPFAENSISSSAIKPSDVLTAYDGRSVEVVDTDAEGRLILADVIAYTVAKWPTAKIMDLATLTGQAENISGKAFSCVLSSNAERETTELIKKSNVINESLVRLPILEKELNKLQSNVADIKNVSYKSSADIIMSSLFIKQFIKPNTKWIHIDIAGPAFHADEVIKYTSPEASGVGVRLLFEYFL